MVSKFEQFVESFGRELEENGHPDKAAVLKALVEEYREDGIPEIFPDRSHQTVSEKRSGEQAQTLIEGRERLVDILSVAKIEPAKPLWTRELAEEMNRKVGQHLGDEVLIKQLVVPTREDAHAKGFDPLQGFGKSWQVEGKTLSAYNGALMAFLRAGYDTLGEIRNSNDISVPAKQTIYSNKTGRNRLETLALVKTAFDRPQPEKQQ